MFHISTPQQAQEIIEAQRGEIKGEPQNLEEQAISLVGREVYTKLIKGYTEKQWGRDCKELPAFIIKRLPVRMIFDNNYFNDKYQGIPVGGYNKLIEGLLDGVECKTGVDFLTTGRPNTEGHPLVIFTNPPFAKGLEFIKHSLELLHDGESCYFLLRLSFLEGQKRQAFFEKQNPEVVAVFGKRITCNRNGSEQMSNSGAVAFAWFKWTKGYIGKTTVEWI